MAAMGTGRSLSSGRPQAGPVGGVTRHREGEQLVRSGTALSNYLFSRARQCNRWNIRVVIEK